MPVRVVVIRVLKLGYGAAVEFTADEVVFQQAGGHHAGPEGRNHPVRAGHAPAAKSENEVLLRLGFA